MPEVLPVILILINVRLFPATGSWGGNHGTRAVSAFLHSVFGRYRRLLPIITVEGV